MLYWNIYSGGVAHFQTAERTLLTGNSRFTCSLNLLENIALYQSRGKIERLNPLELSHIYSHSQVDQSAFSHPFVPKPKTQGFLWVREVTLVIPLRWCATFFDLTLAKKSRSKTETNYLPRKPSVLFLASLFCANFCSISWAHSHFLFSYQFLLGFLRAVASRSVSVSSWLN